MSPHSARGRAQILTINTKSIVGQHEDPQPVPDNLKFVKIPTSERFRKMCSTMCDLDYELANAYLWHKRFLCQLRCLRGMKEKMKDPEFIANCKFKLPKVFEGQEWLIQLTQYRMTHYKLLCDFWHAIAQEEYAKIPIIVSCMCANADRTDEAASELVEMGEINEGQYKEVIEDIGEDYRIYDKMCKTANRDITTWVRFRNAVRENNPPPSLIAEFIEEVEKPAEDVFVFHEDKSELEMNVEI